MTNQPTKDGIALTPLFYVQQGMSSTHSTYFCTADSLAEVKETAPNNPLIIKQIDTNKWDGDFGKMARKKLLTGQYEAFYIVDECQRRPIAETQEDMDKIARAFFTKEEIEKAHAPKRTVSAPYPSNRFGQQVTVLERC